METYSLWQNVYKENYPQLRGKTTADVLVVGGGIAGLTTAYCLARGGADVLLLEALEIGSGVTGHTTAHITSQHDLTWARFIGRFGKHRARLAAQANEAAIEDIERIVRSEKIECDFMRLDSYVYSAEKKGERQVEAESAAAEDLGIRTRMEKGEGFILPCRAACAFLGQAQFHPIKYINGLARAIGKYRCRICEQSRVLHLEGDRAATNEGIVTAPNIVIATHNPIINFPGMYFMRMYQSRASCVALENAPGISGMWNCIDKGQNTYRMYGDLLIVSGADRKTGTKMRVDPYAQLRAFAAAHFKGARPVYAWSAQDGITLDNLPYIGQYGQDTRGLYVATGFGKWGMTQGTIAGRLLGDVILGVKNPYERVYSPQRKVPPIAAWNSLTYNLATAGHLIAGVFQPGAPLCAHMKCRLKWNAFDQTWDCPCHGSRFDKNGEVVDTPAIHGLKKT